MYRLYDFECGKCGRVAEHLIDVPRGEKAYARYSLFCRAGCSPFAETGHNRLATQLFAKYLKDREHNPRVFGGRFDTAGKQELPKLPKLPGIDQHMTKARESSAMFGESPEARRQWRAQCDGPSLADFRAHSQTSEYQEIKRERKEIKKRNSAKQKRDRAIGRGESVNMRWDKLAGDPKL